MVWNTTQSAFYEAIDAFNNGENTSSDQGKSCNSDEEAKAPQKPPENSVKNGDNFCQHCPACQRTYSTGLSRLFSDSDMLLIAGLILILSRQDADRKLILALAFVLLT